MQAESTISWVAFLSPVRGASIIYLGREVNQVPLLEY